MPAAVKAVKTAAKPVKPPKTAVKSVKAAVEPVKTAAEPVETAAKPVKAAAKPVKTAVKSVKAAVKPVETAVKPAKADAIDLLINDHQVVADLFEQFEKAGQRAFKAKLRIVEKITAELTTHAYIEETIFYPEARAAVPATKDHVLESIEEHHLVVWMLAELSGIDPSDERFDAKVTVLIENVRHHVEEEEKEWFPQVRKAMKAEQLRELGQRLAAAKADAPSDPLALPSAKA